MLTRLGGSSLLLWENKGTMATPIQIMVRATQSTGRVIWCDVVIPIPTGKTASLGTTSSPVTRDCTAVDRTTLTCYGNVCINSKQLHGVIVRSHFPDGKTVVSASFGPISLQPQIWLSPFTVFLRRVWVWGQAFERTGFICRMCLGSDHERDYSQLPSLSLEGSMTLREPCIPNSLFLRGWVSMALWLRSGVR